MVLNNKMKVLMLILASDGGTNDIYIKLQQIKRAYIHRFPQVEAYFYKADPNLATDYQIIDDVIYIKTPETYPNLWKKMWLVLKAFEPRFHEFDYICRPNLSTFIIMERYLQHLTTLPKTRCCSGVTHYGGQPIPFPAGYFFTMSPDVAKDMINNDIIADNEGIDDRCIGFILRKLNICITETKYIHISHVHEHASLLPRLEDNDIFMIRIRHFTESPHYRFGIDSSNRLQEDLSVQQTLLKTYYDTDLPL